MKKPAHIISISGGKDSTATMILAVLWIMARGIDLDRVRFVFADTGNEHPTTLAHVAYLSDWLFGMIGKRIDPARCRMVAHQQGRAQFQFAGKHR